jgi:tyrosinase
MTYPITGIQKGLGPSDDPLRKVPLRREIDEWWQSSNLVDVDQKTLFILALDYFQKMDPETMLSYFQVAGELFSSGPSCHCLLVI